MIRLLNLGVGDIGRLEHIRSSLEENKTLYSSDRIYVEKMIEHHIGNQEIIEQVHEIKSEQVQDSNIVEPVNIIQTSKKMGIFNKTETKSGRGKDKWKANLIFVICFAIVWISIGIISVTTNPDYVEKYGPAGLIGGPVVYALLITGIPYIIITRTHSSIKNRNKK